MEICFVVLEPGINHSQSFPAGSFCGVFLEHRSSGWHIPDENIVGVIARGKLPGEMFGFVPN
jgi:hypothetical protein